MNTNPQRLFRKAFLQGQKIFRYSKKLFFSREKAIKPFSGTRPIVAIDAMGGDYAPAQIVAGGIRAARELGVHILMVGPKAFIQAELSRHDTKGLVIEIIDCDDYIGMEEKNPAVAVKKQKNCSVRLAMRLVAEGRAHAVVAAGSTGAAVASALFELKRISGIERPAVACRFPSPKGDFLLLDGGANIDSTPYQIAQHAVMGSIYAQKVLGVSAPTVGLMSIGEEPGKGNKQTKDTFDILNQLQSIKFFGNVEGRVINNREVDVVVCDGFIGNIFLKTVEGSIKMMGTIMSQELKSSLQTQVGALISSPAFGRIKNERLNPHYYGGALLLGVGGVVIISHGNSNDYAIMNACKLAADAARSNIIALIQEQVSADEILKELHASQ